MTVSPQEEFIARLEASVQDGTFARLTLVKPRGDAPPQPKLIIRPATRNSGPHLSFVWRHDRRDTTKKLPPAEGVRAITRPIGGQFHSAHLATTGQGAQ